MTVLRFPRDRYFLTAHGDDDDGEVVSLYCSACPTVARLQEFGPPIDLSDVADAVYLHERMLHGG